MTNHNTYFENKNPITQEDRDYAKQFKSIEITKSDSMEVRKAEFTKENDFFTIQNDEDGYLHFFTLETMGNLMVQLGMIDDYHLEGESVEIQVPVFSYGIDVDEFEERTDYKCIYDFILELDLSEYGRLLKAFLDNDKENQKDDLPF